MYKTTGRLRMFTKWALLDCGRELAKYYCSLYNRELFYRPPLQPPLWGAHVSIIRGEIELCPLIKAELNDMEIEFYYIPQMMTNGCHFYLPVICPLLDDIRELFGLGQSVVSYHLSIGNLRNAQ